MWGSSVYHLTTPGLQNRTEFESLYDSSPNNKKKTNHFVERNVEDESVVCIFLYLLPDDSRVKRLWHGRVFLWMFCFIDPLQNLSILHGAWRHLHRRRFSFLPSLFAKLALWRDCLWNTWMKWKPGLFPRLEIYQIIWGITAKKCVYISGHIDLFLNVLLLKLNIGQTLIIIC